MTLTNATLYLAGTRKVTEVGISLLSATMTVEEWEDNVVIIDHRFVFKGLLLSEKLSGRNKAHTAAASGETWYKIRGILYQDFCNLVPGCGWFLLTLQR